MSGPYYYNEEGQKIDVLQVKRWVPLSKQIKSIPELEEKILKKNQLSKYKKDLLLGTIKECLGRDDLTGINQKIVLKSKDFFNVIDILEISVRITDEELISYCNILKNRVKM